MNNPSAYLFDEVLTPLHEDLESISLYDDSGMVGVTMCVDAAKPANGACGSDPRGGRTEYARCYPEDYPSGGCGLHTSVEYCSGGGVATEYCHKFAEVDSSVSIGSKGLLKVSSSQLSSMLAPGGYMPDSFRQNNYIYLSSGTFHGISGNLTQWRDAPYLICPEHTQAAWEKYEQEQMATEPPTDPAAPADPIWPEAPFLPLPG